MVNILLIQDTDWIARGPHQQHHVFERLGARGDAIHVIDFELLWEKNKRKRIFEGGTEITPVAKTVKQSNVVVHRPPMIKIPLLDKLTIPIFHSFWINKVIHKYRIDVIVGQTVLNSFFGLVFARLYKIPFIFHCIDSIHSLSADYIPSPFVLIAKTLERLISRFSSMNIAINKALRSYVVSLGGKEEKTVFIPTGVDFQRYQDVASRLQKRIELGIEDADLVLFFMGWLYSFSGLKELADRVVRDPGGRLKLVIVGDGDLLPDLAKVASTTSKIIVTGRVPFTDIPKLLSAADICILPSQKNEIMTHIVPIKIYEYMAAGKPVIATKLPGIVQEFGHSNGIMYCKDNDDLIKIALKLLNEKQLHVVGEKGQNYTSRCDWQDISFRYRRMILNLISENVRKRSKKTKLG